VTFGLLSLLRESPLVFVLLAAALVGALSMHEYAHALAADLQGDRLPRAMGRLTLNPARHLDPLGTICILIVGFGWGKPVEFRPQALRSKRFGAAIVALAGPLMNLALALAAAFVYVLLDLPVPGAVLREPGLVFAFSEDLGVAASFLILFFALNVFLAVFNLLPLPPLDGSRLLTIFLPPAKQKIIFFLDQYGFLILLVLVFFGGFRFLEPLVNWVVSFLLNIAGA
jgi:Zn-dependent protease